MKHTLLVPIAGDGQRFIDNGFKTPKPLITIPDGRTILEYSLSSINLGSCDEIIFVVQRKHIEKNGIKKWLENKWPNSKVIVAEGKTDGTVASCLLAKDLINKNKPLAIYCPDVWFDNQIELNEEMYQGASGFLLTFKANSNKYSYAKIKPGGLVEETREKEVISEQAAVGLYCFWSGKAFVKYAEKMIREDIRTNGEFYLCPIYNLLIKDGLEVRAQEVQKMYVLGTPDEFNFIKQNVFDREQGVHVGLVSDHSGYHLKEEFKKWLKKEKINFKDWGCHSTNPCDYPYFVEHGVMDLERQMGASIVLGFCRSGQGVNISAQNSLSCCTNMFSALVWNEWMAEHAVRHNAARFFAVPTQFVDLEELKKIYKTIQGVTFDGGRHMNRLMSI